MTSLFYVDLWGDTTWGKKFDASADQMENRTNLFLDFMQHRVRKNLWLFGMGCISEPLSQKYWFPGWDRWVPIILRLYSPFPSSGVHPSLEAAVCWLACVVHEAEQHKLKKLITDFFTSYSRLHPWNCACSTVTSDWDSDSHWKSLITESCRAHKQW